MCFGIPCRSSNYCDMKKLSSMWQMFVLLCMLLGGLSSCGNDEPEADCIVYYIDVEADFRVNGSDYIDTYKDYNPITMMKAAIAKAYPEPDLNGYDMAVIEACDGVYQWFYSAYSGNGDHLTCLVHLVRAHRVNGIIRQSQEIKTYNIDVNPIEQTTE